MSLEATRRLVAALSFAVLMLAGCSQTNDTASLEPQFVVPEPALEFSKELTVRHAQSVEPRVTDKSATHTEVDVTSGSAELSYTMVVEDVVTGVSDSATAADLAISNTGTTSVTVDVTDTLYCGDGTGSADLGGPLAIVVHQADDVTIAAGATHTVTGPFGPYDVAACPDSSDGTSKDVVNRIVVRDAATDALLGQADLLPTSRLATSSTAAAVLVDEEQIPEGYSITGASLTSGGADVAFSASASGSTYTIVSDGPVGAGTYLLTKTLTRDAGASCEPDLEVVNTAYMSSDGTEAGMVGSAATATIALLCTDGGGEGCTPGFWRNWIGVPPGNQPNAWVATGFHWGDAFTSAGFVDAFHGASLLDVVSKGGGGKNALGRHAVAALLNAAHPDVAYDLTVAQVVAMFNDVIENDGSVNDLTNTFQGLNEQGCPLSQAEF